MLGSTDIITNAAGSVVAQMSFDAFGKRRNLLTLADLVKADYEPLNALTTQGFTGHEMVDEAGVIHMGGRIYDPKLARFMSADPIVSDLTNVQRLNRYSYVLNSPLSYTDPTGFDQCPPDSATCISGGNPDYSAWNLIPTATNPDTHVKINVLTEHEKAQQAAAFLVLMLAFDNIGKVVQSLSCAASDTVCHDYIADKIVEAAVGAVGGNQDSGDGETFTPLVSGALAGLFSGVGSVDERQEHWDRNRISHIYDDVPITVFALMAEENWEERWVVRTGVATHNFDTEGNVDFRETGPCPCRQLVYDREGILVTDQTNGGSLDFVSPDDSASGHFTDDVLPWIKFGNGPDDRTTPFERFQATLKTIVTSREVDARDTKAEQALFGR